MSTTILNLTETNSLTLKAAFPLINYGIFDFLSSMSYSEYFTSVELNNTLYFTHGTKFASPVLAHFMSNSKPGIDGLHTVDDTDAQTIADMIKARYSEKWTRYGAIVDAQYNPIENYNMVERENASNASVERGESVDANSLQISRQSSSDDSGTRAANNANITARTGNNTSDSSNATNTAATNDDSALNGVYGFNSQSSVNHDRAESSGKTLQSSSGINKTSNALDEKVNNSTSQTETAANNRRENESHAEIGNETRTDNLNKSSNTIRGLTRSGNIGVTTTQQMLNQEREFWRWSYIKEIVSDVAEFLTLSVY